MTEHTWAGLGRLWTDLRTRLPEPVLAVGAFAAATLVLALVSGAPTEILVVGAVLGSLSGLVAMGLVLTYQSNRIINFAIGDLGGMAGVLMASLITGAGWAFFPALIVGLLAGTVTGGIAEVTLIRRFSTAPRLILTVATVLIATLLASLQLIIPTLFDLEGLTLDLPVPFPSFSWQLGLVRFRSVHFIVVLVVPLAAGLLAWFLGRTRTGKAVRASAESGDRALLLGIPVRRISTTVWVVAAALSATSAVLRTLLVGAPFGAVIGPSLLARALAAAVIARMERLWLALGTAIFIGMVEEVVFFETSRSTLVEPVLFGIVLLALIVRSRGVIARAQAIGASTWSAIREVRPVPSELAGVPLVRIGGWAIKLALAAVALWWPLTMGPGRVVLVSYGVIYAIVGISLVVLTGWTGQISLGQLGIAGVGAAVVAALHAQGVDVLLALAAGAVASAAIAVALGIPALRIPGLFLAVATYLFTLACQSFFLNPTHFGWIPEGRLPVRPALFGRFNLETEHTYYFFCAAILVLVLAALRSIRATRSWRAMVAVRDNERSAQSSGVSPVRTKLAAFALSGFLAGLAGGMLALHQHQRMTVLLGPVENLRLFLIAVVGGLGSVTGVLVAVALFQVVDHAVASQQFRVLFNGLGVLVILLAHPTGIGGLMYRVRDWILARIALARGVDSPSLVDEREPAEVAT